MENNCALPTDTEKLSPFVTSDPHIYVSLALGCFKGKKIIRDGAKISLSPRRMEVIQIRVSMLENFGDEAGSASNF